MVFEMALQTDHKPPGVSLLADHLASRKDELMDAWLSSMRAHPDIASTESLTRKQLADHLPLLFENLVERLRTATEIRQEGPGPEARKHGAHRWSQGYRIDELFKESSLLRNIVMQHLLLTFDGAGANFSQEDERFAKDVIQEFFDRLVENSVEQYVDEQQRQIKQFSGELERHNLLLAESIESRVGLMRSVSHELRNSLEAQRVILAVISKSEGQVKDDDLVEVARRNLDDMGEMLGQLLEYSSLLAKQERGEFDRFSAREFFDGLKAIWGPLAAESGVTLEADFDDGLETISSDRTKLGQVARNLLSNAVKFRSDERPSKVGLVFTKIDDLRWRLSVWDNGIGIGETDLERLFQEFSRINPREGVAGSGLGLAITQQTVELLGGRIDVTSTYGEGSKFDVNLPLGGSEV